MKKKLQIATIALFMAFLSAPLLCTPFLYQQERKTLHAAERRDPKGTLSFAGCDRSIQRWVKEIQTWYADSFAFRSRMMEVYNLSHYLIHNYLNGYYGRDGHLFKKKQIHQALRPIRQEEEDQISACLAQIHQDCMQAKTPCLFILIPAKETIHPELAPRWIRERIPTLAQKREKLLDLIRTNHFPARRGRILRPYDIVSLRNADISPRRGSCDSLARRAAAARDRRRG